MTDEARQGEFVEEEIEQDQYIVFKVRGQEYGFRVIQVREISTVLATTQVPNAPPYIDGIMNLRGRLASVINFRKRLGFEPKQHDEDTRIIIMEQGGFPIGLVVDGVEEVLQIPQEIVQEMPENTTASVSAEYISGVGILDERLIILLDVDKVLTKGEWIEARSLGQGASEISDTQARNADMVGSTSKEPEREAKKKKSKPGKKKAVKKAMAKAAPAAEATEK